MMPPPALLDTDILSETMRKHPQAIVHAQSYLAEHSAFTFSLISRYEILRGLKTKRAAVQLVAFHRFCAVNHILPITNEIVERAADIYADLHRRGLLIGDADILIAATAMEHGLALCTNNTRHYSRVTGLHLVNWLL